jgi:FkbM family methyltransferase
MTTFAVRQRLANLVGGVVDSLGGVGIALPSGDRARVAFRCRRLGRDYEKPVMDAFVRELRPDAVVFDVGAHWGLYTLVAARRAKRVVAFEPSGHNRALLTRNVKLAGLKNVQVRPELVADRVGTTTFHDYQGPPSHDLSMMGGLLPQRFTRPVEAPVTTIDALDIEPDVLKIDVEGAEASVLAGAARVLRDARPTILVEVHHERVRAMGSSADDVRAALENFDYRIDTLTSIPSPGELVSHWLCRSSAAGK